MACRCGVCDITSHKIFRLSVFDCRSAAVHWPQKTTAWLCGSCYYNRVANRADRRKALDFLCVLLWAQNVNEELPMPVRSDFGCTDVYASLAVSNVKQTRNCAILPHHVGKSEPCRFNVLFTLFQQRDAGGVNQRHLTVHCNNIKYV